MTEKIQVQYDELEQLASRIIQQSEDTHQLYNRVRAHNEALAKSWIGEGAMAYQREMEELVLPGMRRLTASLEVTGRALQKIVQIFREAEEEAAGNFPGGEGAASGGGGGGRVGSTSGGGGRPGLPGGAGAPRSSIGRAHEPLRVHEGMIQQNAIMDLERTNPTEAGKRYKDLVAEDMKKGLSAEFKIGGAKLKVDIGTDFRVTLEGVNGPFSNGKLDQFWGDLASKGKVSLTVPLLSAEAEDQLQRLLAQARETINPEAIIIVRETLPK
jgi:WXG100 family type VII secretion target